jgi:hypothetical protein
MSFHTPVRLHAEIRCSEVVEDQVGRAQEVGSFASKAIAAQTRLGRRLEGNLNRAPEVVKYRYVRHPQLA